MTFGEVKCMVRMIYICDNKEVAITVPAQPFDFRIAFWLGSASIFHLVFLGFSDAILGTIPILAASCFCLVLIW